MKKKTIITFVNCVSIGVYGIVVRYSLNWASYKLHETNVLYVLFPSLEFQEEKKMVTFLFLSLSFSFYCYAENILQWIEKFMSQTTDSPFFFVAKPKSYFVSTSFKLLCIQIKSILTVQTNTILNGLFDLFFE